MKKSILFLGVLVIALTSCKKEPIVYPSEQYGATTVSYINDTGVCMWGEFLIIDAKMYINNHETGSKTVLNHFGTNKSRSSLRYGGSKFDIETIIKDTTTYSFHKPSFTPGYGIFLLNNDTSKHYSVYHTKHEQAIVEDPTHNEHNLGGSSRPFSGITIDKVNKIIVLHIQDMEGSINGYNCYYWTEITLKQIVAF